jgi:hypothetical protein
MKTGLQNTLTTALTASSAAALVTLFGASQASAASFSFTNADVVEQNGLSWLKLDVTKGKTYNQVKNAFSGDLSGWRYASDKEVLDAWSGASKGANYLGDMLGNSFSQYWTGGIVDSESITGITIITDNKGYGSITQDLWTRTGWSKDSVMWESSFLVRTTTSSKSQEVPEPITGLVLAAGMGGAALRRAKKSKQN